MTTQIADDACVPRLNYFPTHCGMHNVLPCQPPPPYLTSLPSILEGSTPRIELIPNSTPKTERDPHKSPVW